MVRKKIDNRIRVMLENGVALGHRTLYVIVGDKGKDQVVIIHHMLSKASIKARPSVLWCYKKELGFSSHRKKRMKQLQQKMKSGRAGINEDDPFELFVSSTNIRYCYYKETHKILGNTFGMCVLQDFEALTPNLLCRTIETVEGGGAVVLLLRSVASLRQLYTLSMDVHARYRTEAHQDIVARFNERFLLSLTSCEKCLVLDDQLEVLPLSSHALNVTPVAPHLIESRLTSEDLELVELKKSLQDTQPVGVLLSKCKTLDQAKALLKFVEAISEKTLRTTVSLTASRGRGKSAALGLAIAASVAFGYSNIFVTSPSPENLHTLFEFIFKGFDALDYQEHMDYDLVQSTNPEFNKAVVRVNVFREHRQTIQYIHPYDAKMLGQAELVVIDEAAAIPLPLVKSLLGPYLVFMASTINGYEGTGRSLSLKLLEQLRKQTLPSGVSAQTTTHKDKKKKTAHEDTAMSTGRVLFEVTLTESIRYATGDNIESWLIHLLCLDATSAQPIVSGCPPPSDCELYYINRDTLFSYHKASEDFLQQIMALYVSSHYKNSPNDLQLLSDAPAHHLFCLLGPSSNKTVPEVLVVLQICLEGEISESSVDAGLSRGKKASGDLIPWTIAQQFQDPEFPGLAGARVVRIATHPDYQGMGYGKRAMELLQLYYEMKMPWILEAEKTNISRIKPTSDEELGLLTETIVPRKNLPPLLLTLFERRPEPLDYLGVSFGLTEPLLRFWRRIGYVPVYIRQTANDLTGEFSCIMLKVLDSKSAKESSWLSLYYVDFKRRFVSLLGAEFSKFPPKMSLGVLFAKSDITCATTLSKDELEIHVNKYERKRIEAYSRNLVDYHLITDILPRIAELYFLQKMGSAKLSATQAAILMGTGLQRKRMEEISNELELPVHQTMALFQRAIKHLVSYMESIEVNAVESTLAGPREINMKALDISLDKELAQAAKDLYEKQHEEMKKMKVDLDQYSIKGSDVEWQKVLSKGGPKGLVSVQSGFKRPLVDSKMDLLTPPDEKKRKKKKHNKSMS